MRASGLFGLLLLLSVMRPAAACPAAETTMAWGGHLKTRGSLSSPDEATVYRLVGTGPAYDGDADLRLKHRTRMGEAFQLDVHYEAWLTGGDTRRSRWRLAATPAAPAALRLADYDGADDSRRLFDLTRVVSDRADHRLYHRLDRLSLSFRPPWGTVTLGRQALTWGNGLIFNPMDLFNPFAPTDVVRDYKVGDDMAVVQIDLGGGGDLQVLYVPRRPADGADPAWDASSLAAKAHGFAGRIEFDLMAARHYRDIVLGGGLAGEVGDAAWRADTVWTLPGADCDGRSYLSFVVNLDYSWTWHQRNWYGLVEYLHNDLGGTDYASAPFEPRIGDRLARGELFGLGRDYLALQLRWEIHPLLNLYLTPITNLADPSGLVQPYLVWDVTQNLRATAGAVAYWGASETEYGGYRLAGTAFMTAPADTVFVMLTRYF